MYALDELITDIHTFRRAIQHAQPYHPLAVKLKLVARCNLRCQMCNHWRRPYHNALSRERLHALIDELAAMGCRKLHISGGEPLLHPETLSLIAYATELGIRVNMTSNGTLIDKAMAKAVIDAGLRTINISLDSPERKVHEKVRGVPGAWKKTTQAISYLHRWQHKGKLTIRVNTVVSRITYDTLTPLPDLVHSLGANHLNLIGVDDHCGNHLALSRRHIEHYNAHIAPYIAARACALGLMHNEHNAYPFGQLPHEIRHSKRGHFAAGWYDTNPCYAPWTHALIDYNGDVYPCCMLRERIMPLGNLQHVSFAAIWSGERYRAIRQQMHPPSFAACASCDDFLEENRLLHESMTRHPSCIICHPYDMS